MHLKVKKKKKQTKEKQDSEYTLPQLPWERKKFPWWAGIIMNLQLHPISIYFNQMGVRLSVSSKWKCE